MQKFYYSPADSIIDLPVRMLASNFAPQSVQAIIHSLTGAWHSGQLNFLLFNGSCGGYLENMKF